MTVNKINNVFINRSVISDVTVSDQTVVLTCIDPTFSLIVSFCSSTSSRVSISPFFPGTGSGWSRSGCGLPDEAVVDSQDDGGQRHGQHVDHHGGQSHPLLVGFGHQLRLLLPGIGGRFAPLRGAERVGPVLLLPHGVTELQEEAVSHSRAERLQSGGDPSASRSLHPPDLDPQLESVRFDLRL